MERAVFPPAKWAAASVLAIFLFAVLIPVSGLAQTTEKPKKQDEQEKPVKITEEIQVIGKAPREIPLATVTTISTTLIFELKPRDLSEAIKYAPGVYVTVGNKEEYKLKLRGIDSTRIALLVDGVPVVEPYFGSFDLKTVSAGGIQSLQITKGPSSVLYGPNTLGGIVNVITKRPALDPTVSLSLALGNLGTRTGGFDTSFQWNRIGVVASALYQDSDGFKYKDAAGAEQTRTNSDFQRLNLTGKLVYNPTDRSEVMLDTGYYHSVYGMPPALFGRPRYWRFPDWNRTSLNAGGFTALGDSATLRFRAFYVNYDNTLDQFQDSAMTVRQFESTFDNSVYGFFGMGDFSLASWNTLKVSLYFQGDKARQQDDVGLPWYEYKQNTISGAVEEHVALADKWTLIGGLSLDTLDKYIGPTTSRVNPLVGVKFSPTEALDVHLSFAGKSKFPSMRSLYSTSNGNPDLLSEYGWNSELSATYNAGFFITGSIFTNAMRNFIDTVTLPDGTRRFINIGKARINGAEVQVQKTWGWLSGTVNYTFLDHKNITNDRPLDILSKHTLSFDGAFVPIVGFRLGVFGLLASKSWFFDTNSSTLLTIPSYFSLDAVASYKIGYFEPFLRITNIFNHYYYTEPGFPWRGRFFEIGFRAGLD